jgi:acetoacetate decarboxylase
MTSGTTPLTGWTLPQSPSGTASLLPAPPWHYSGEVIAVDYTADPGRVAELVPPGFEPAGDGSCSFVFCDWSSAADRDPRIKDDPAKGQYREAYLVLHGSFGAKRAGRVPFIWVDSDLSLVRGLIQGFPKKLGEIHMTRPVELGRGGARKAPGERFRAHVSAMGRRLVDLTVTIDEPRDTTYPRGVAAPLVHTRLWPSIDRDEPAVHELARGTIQGFEVGTVWHGAAELEIGASEHEEIDRLAPVSTGDGWVLSMAFSVTGGTVEPLGTEPRT